jgi:hypothetical protein
MARDRIHVFYAQSPGEGVDEIRSSSRDRDRRAVSRKQVLRPKRQGIPIRPDINTPTRHDRLAADEPDQR